MGASLLALAKSIYYLTSAYWPCNALFFHFSSFIDFILDLNLCFRAVAFSEAELSSLLSISGIVTSLLHLLVAFLVTEFLVVDCSCSSTFFGYCPSSQIVIEPYCYCFECCFCINQAPFSTFSWDVQSFHVYFRM